MDVLTSDRLRELFLGYFAGRGHAVLPSASLVPENDPTALFTTAGMHPLIPYLLGAPHPLGRRLASAQKCLRTDDLEEVGDATHLTFFEMLGNWSLGDYFKEESIRMSFEFLTSDRWLGLPKERLAVTCFEGDLDAPKDTESARAWEALGIPHGRIFFFGKRENWWGPPGKTGPCGPDTEIFFDTGAGSADAVPNDASERYVEIWNNVFMEFRKREDGAMEPSKQKNVDTGMGLERALAALNGFSNVYETDVFAPLVAEIRSHVPSGDLRMVRIVSDHLRAAVFLLADSRGIVPSNLEQGYVLRRLIRRSLRGLSALGASDARVPAILRGAVSAVGMSLGSAYPEVRSRASHAEEQLEAEFRKYASVVQRAERIIEERAGGGRLRMTGEEAFAIYQETGAHPDLLRSLGARLGVQVDTEGFDRELERHQEVSRAGISQRFEGGLADNSEKTVKLHTATHLLHEALRRVLGTHVEQKGSNITAERLRFDFSHPRNVTEKERALVEALVNEQIARDLPVTKTILSPAEAKVQGALGYFKEKYGEHVNVYAIGDYSKEICGGPHVARTGVLGHFRIVKSEGLSAGVRRIRAVVE